MQQQRRKIQVDSGVEVSSVWAIPDHYHGRAGSAIILAHGAGSDMEHPFISHFHQALADAGLLSVKFNFPYKEQGRKAPDRMPLLESTWRAVIHAVSVDQALSPQRLYLAGKSMGGRVASQVAARGEPCQGLVFLGYPLHPPKQTDKVRVEHWSKLSCPILFLQGTRDSLCDLSVLRTLLPRIPAPVTLQLIEGGDHSFKVLKSSGRTDALVWQEMVSALLGWLRTVGSSMASG